MPGDHNDSGSGSPRSGGSGARHKVRLPGFLADDQEVGLGDVIKRATYRAGIKPCSGCSARAESLNRFLGFTGRPRRQG